MILRGVLRGLILAAEWSLVSAGTLDPSLVREERTVTVDGVKETWRLVWHEPPQPECQPGNPSWFTCGCAGFAFGEKGDLNLVRLRENREVERFPLTPFFGPDSAFDGKAVVPRFPVRRNDVDVDVDGQEDLGAKVSKRPVVKIMDLRDYDHDGQAAEFFLQLGTLPCGKEMGIVVGISRHRPGLHAFGTIENPDKPLQLLRSHWADLARTKVPIQRLEWACGDHGSDARTDVFLRADEHGIHASRRDYECREDGGRGPIVREEWL